MTSVIEKRLSLHKRLQVQEQQNNALKSQITQLQTLANIGTITYMIAHEINNLLTPVGSYANLALKNPEEKGLAQKALRKTIKNCERASKIMESMLAVANGDTQEKKNTRLLTLVEDVFTCLCRDFTKDGIAVRIDVPADLMLWAVPVQVQQVLMNLILNARDAMLTRGGVLTIGAKDGNDQIHIEVSDTGDGIERENLENIFDSFFTTKADLGSRYEYSGAGLGLAFCRKTINAHGGTICVESEPNIGTTFKITLPKEG